MKDTAETGRAFAPRFSLRAQVAVLLAIAISPIGAVGISQALFTVREATELAEGALSDKTRLAADEERAAITEAFGAAHGLSAALPVRPEEQAACSELMERFVASDPKYVFALVVQPDGSVNCASGRQRPAFVAAFDVQRMRQEPQRRVRLTGRDDVLQDAVLNLVEPVYREGAFAAYLVVSVPSSLLTTLVRASDEDVDFRLALFDRDGTVFAQDAGEVGDLDWGPVGRPLAGESGVVEQVFTGRSRLGEWRSYAIVPVFRDDIYALGSWRESDLEGASWRRTSLAILFPAAMWILALGVSYFAVHRLAVRHITYLSRVMRAFESGRRGIRARGLQEAPIELRELGVTFDRLAETIERDETALGHAVEEKTTLLKEVYHRVKNNLQLVISMMNIQMRRAGSDTEKAAIARLQERVMGLAAVHQKLYQASDLSAVRCDELLREIIFNLCGAPTERGGRVRVETELAPLVLGPDQAIPMALFATETLINALKHGRAGGDGWIRVKLAETDDGQLCFSVANAAPKRKAAQDEASGIGSQLIRAFARQLGGEVEIGVKDGIFEVLLEFVPQRGPVAAA